MGTFRDLASASFDEGPLELTLVRLGFQPTLFRLIDDEVEDVRLHWEKDETINGHVRCLQQGCPLCLVGSVPSDYVLMSVYVIDAQQVQVLRISKREGPHTFLAALRPHFTDPRIDEKFLSVTYQRSGRTRYTVESAVFGPNADRGDAVIERFREARANGLELASALPSFTPERMAEIPRVRQLLAATGAWPPSVGDSDDDEGENEHGTFLPRE